MTPVQNFAGCAGVGKRERQEDFYAFLPIDNNALLAILADGMGGHVGGAEASRIATNAFIEHFTRAAKHSPLSPEILQAANHAIADQIKNDESLAGMGCTLVAALIDGGGVQWLSVGDSLLYVFADGRLKKINADHSLGGMLDQAAADGKITMAQAADNPQRHALYSALMGDEIALIDQGEMAFDAASPPLLLVASDGLLTLSEADIADCLRRLENDAADKIAAALVQEVESHNAPHQDNTTVLVIKPLGRQ